VRKKISPKRKRKQRKENGGRSLVSSEGGRERGRERERESERQRETKRKREGERVVLLLLLVLTELLQQSGND